MFTILFFALFATLAVGCALAVVVQRNPIYCAISLIGVFLSLPCLYLLLAAPFVAAVQVIVYAGAIMVLVVFVIMLLNVEDEEHRITRLRALIPTAIIAGVILLALSLFMINSVRRSPLLPTDPVSPSNVGLTGSIGEGLFTVYLLPFEITSLLLLMAIVGAMSLARRKDVSDSSRVIPGAQVLPRHLVDPSRVADQTPVETDSTSEAAGLLGLPHDRVQSEP